MDSNHQTEEGSTIQEGKAKISQKSGVFYNKVQEFNRDLRFKYNIINNYFDNLFF